MTILENKQYTFNFEFDFASGTKSIKCHLFIYNNKIQVVSFLVKIGLLNYPMIYNLKN